jgi:hypothetical protein
MDETTGDETAVAMPFDGRLGAGWEAKEDDVLDDAKGTVRIPGQLLQTGDDDEGPEGISVKVHRPVSMDAFTKDISQDLASKTSPHHSNTPRIID